MSNSTFLDLRSDHVANITKYHYEALPGPQDIRILELQPASDLRLPLRASLTVKCLTFVPDYEALSYTWQPTFEDEVLPEQTLYISYLSRSTEYSLEIGGNLAFALRRLRYENRPRLLWVDAVCINMGAISERNTQVAMMAGIYLTASAVLVWLGEDSKLKDAEYVWRYAARADPKFTVAESTSSTSEEAYSTFRARIEEHAVQTQALSSHASNRCIDSDRESLIGRFVRRRYFHRRWIVQEIFYGASITVICGSMSTTLTGLVGALKWFCVPRSRDQQVQNCFTWLKAIENLRDSSDSGLHHAMRSMYTFQQLDCHDARDRVYALASLWNNGALTINYALSCEEVYLNFARSLVKACYSIDSSSTPESELTRLIDGALSQARDCPVTGQDQLPSWVPDWRLDVPYISSPRHVWSAADRFHGDIVVPKRDAYEYSVRTVNEDRLELRVRVIASVISAADTRVRLWTDPGVCQTHSIPHLTKPREFCVAEASLVVGDLLCEPLVSSASTRAELRSVWLRPVQFGVNGNKCYRLLQHGPRCGGGWKPYREFFSPTTPNDVEQGADMPSLPNELRAIIV